MQPVKAMWRFNLNGQNDRFFQNLNGTRCEKSEIRNQKSENGKRKTEISFDSNFGELPASGAAAKKAVSVSQACLAPQVSPSGYHAARLHSHHAPRVRTDSVHLEAAFGRAYGRRRLYTALQKQGVAIGAALGTHPDVCKQAAASVPAQVHPYHR